MPPLLKGFSTFGCVHHGAVLEYGATLRNYDKDMNGFRELKGVEESMWVEGENKEV